MGHSPALCCWADHARLLRDVEAPDADPMTIRWVGDLEADDCRRRNLAGRACHLADGLSRHNEEHSAFLRRGAHWLKNLTLDGIGDEDEEVSPWALLSQSAPAAKPRCNDSQEAPAAKPKENEPGLAALVPPRAADAALGQRSGTMAAAHGQHASHAAAHGQQTNHPSCVAAVGGSSGVVALLLPGSGTQGLRLSHSNRVKEGLRRTVVKVAINHIEMTPPPFLDNAGSEVFLAPPIGLTPPKRAQN